MLDKHAKSTASKPRSTARTGLHAFALSIFLGLGATPLYAQAQEAPVSISIAAQPLDTALEKLGEQAGLQIFYRPDTVRGLNAPNVSGSLTVDDALRRLLAGTGVEFRRTGRNVSLSRPEPGDTAQLEPIRVQGRLDGTTEGTGSYTTRSMSTATGLDLSLRETPQSVTVLTRQRMNDEGLVTISDAIAATPGLVLNKRAGERHSFYARGFQIGNITYDGLPTSLDNSYYGSEILLSDLAAYDRVEVVRGAAGLMSGAGNPSAAVNLVRKRPTKETQISLTGNVGSWNHYGLQGDVSGGLNEADTLRARAVASWQDSDSFQDVASGRRKILYLVAEADLSQRTLLNLGVSHQENDNTATWGGLPASADGHDLGLSRSTYLGNAWDRWNKRSDTLFSSLEHRFDSGWKLHMAATRINAKLLIDASNAMLNPGTGLYDQFMGEYHYTDKQNSYGLQVSGPFRFLGREHELVLGANRRDGSFDGYGGGVDTFTGMDIHNWTPSVIAKPEVNLDDWFTRSADRQRSIYATTRISLADPLKLIVGGRFDWYDFQGQTQWSDDDYTVNRNLTKYAGLIYDIDAHHSVYLSYTDIFKPQNYYDTASNLLSPVVGKNYEIGIKGEYFDGRLNASAAVFRIDQENLAMPLADQTVCPSYPAQSCYEPAGLVRSQGLDLELQGGLTPNWQIGAGYTYVDKVIRKNADPAREGMRADTYLPKHQFKLFTLYRFSNEWLNGRWRVGGSLNWQSETYQESTNFRFTQKAYAVVGLVAGYEVGKHLDVQLNINNLFDKTYYEGLSTGPTSSTAVYGAPRNFMLTSKYTF